MTHICSLIMFIYASHMHLDNFHMSYKVPYMEWAYFKYDQCSSYMPHVLSHI